MLISNKQGASICTTRLAESAAYSFSAASVRGPKMPSVASPV